MTKTASKLIFSSLSMLACLLTLSDCRADSETGLYFGGLGGYGSTNWSKIHTSDPTLQASLPSSTQDNGAVWGLFVGDNIGEHYGVELRYQHFADSKISFAQYNEYAPPPDFNPFTMISKTENYELLGTLRVLATQRIELYSVIGGTYTMRHDELGNVSGFGGVFGGGTRYIFSKHLSSAIEFDFATGNAAITLEPATNYLPFLTSLSYKFIYSI